MKLPNSDQVIIAPAKITKYLLDLEHPKGKSKAKFFISFGFSFDSWEKLDEALRQHAQDHEVTSTVKSPHGIKYIIEGSLPAPDGRSPLIRSVWIIDNGEEFPRLSTAYPP